MILTRDQLHALTGKTRPSAQCRALDHMGIGYVRRPDGSPVVTWESVGRRVPWTGEPFQLRDLRAKSASDHESGAHLGHRSSAVLRRFYERKAKEVKGL